MPPLEVAGEAPEGNDATADPEGDGALTLELAGDGLTATDDAENVVLDVTVDANGVYAERRLLEALATLEGRERLGAIARRRAETARQQAELAEGYGGEDAAAWRRAWQQQAASARRATAILAGKLAAPARQPVIHVPARRENASRPRERRARRGTAPTRGDPDSSEPSRPVLIRLAESGAVGRPEREEATVSTTPLPVVGFDPLRDKSYQSTRLGRDVADFLAWMELGGARPRTLDQYERDLARACLMFPDRKVDELTDGDLLHVIRSWPPRSRRVRKAALDSFFKWAVKTRRVERNPTDLLPTIKRTPQRYIDTFSESELEDLLALPHVDAVLMAILVDAGLRKGEARTLQVRRLKVDTGELIIIGGKGDKDRLVPMTTRLRTALEGFLLLEQLAPADYLWYTRPGGAAISRRKEIGEGSFYRWWKRCLEQSGVRYRNPHVARHTFATRWLRRGGRLETLSVAMGHESIRTTFDLYGHLDTRDVRADLLLIEGNE